MRKLVLIAVLLLPTLLIASNSYRRTGIVTHYGYGFHHKRSGASGIKVDANMPIAASREIPYGAIVLVENTDDTSPCKGNKMNVMIFDWGPSANPSKRIFDMMPNGGFYSYKGKPGIAEKGRGGVKVKIEVINLDNACVPERLGSERQAKGEYFCLRSKYGKWLTYDKIDWLPYYNTNKECYNNRRKK